MPRYAAPNGTGDGTLDDPMSMDAALTTGGEVWLMPGRYAGDWTIAMPITLRPIPGAHVVLDGAVEILADDVTLDGLEITYTGWPSRMSAYPGSTPPDVDQKWLNMFGKRAKVHGCHIHDLAGVGWWRDATDSEISRCHIYNNGWQGPDRGHGPAIYAQNTADGDKLVKDCVICPSYSFTGFQFFGTQTAPLERFHIERNVLIGTRFILGGGMPVNDAHAIGNRLWQSNMQIGYTSPRNGSAEIRDNYIGLAYMAPHTLTELQMTGNTVINRDGIELMNLTMPDAPYSYAIDGNTYLSNRAAVLWNDGDLQDFAQWQTSGYDQNGAFGALPTAPVIFVGAGNVTIFNWEEAASVPAPIAGRYTNALNPAESVALAEGDPLPMDGWTVQAPYAASAPLFDWDSRFGCFLVTP